MNILDQLADKYKTDKGSWHHDYTRFYDRLMGCEREAVTAILEIGVGTGASARMWLDYFPNALVHVVDIDPEAIKRLTEATYPGRDRLRAITSNQARLLWDYMPVFDYVIDDGSHFPEDQIRTFEKGFNKVKSGGLWFIEDTHCNFHSNFNPGGVDVLYNWLHSVINKQQTLGYDGSGNFYEARKKNKSNDPINDLMWQIYSITSYRSCIVFERAED